MSKKNKENKNLIKEELSDILKEESNSSDDPISDNDEGTINQPTGQSGPENTTGQSQQQGEELDKSLGGAKKKGNAPWKRKSVLDVKDTPGVRYKWVNQAKDGRVQHMQLEGWKISERKGVSSTESGVDAHHQVGDLVLMEIPQDRYEARVDHYRQQQPNAEEAAEQFQQIAGDNFHADTIANKKIRN